MCIRDSLNISSHHPLPNPLQRLAQRVRSLGLQITLPGLDGLKIPHQENKRWWVSLFRLGRWRQPQPPRQFEERNQKYGILIEFFQIVIPVISSTYSSDIFTSALLNLILPSRIIIRFDESSHLCINDPRPRAIGRPTRLQLRLHHFLRLGSHPRPHNLQSQRQGLLRSQKWQGKGGQDQWPLRPLLRNCLARSNNALPAPHSQPQKIFGLPLQKFMLLLLRCRSRLWHPQTRLAERRKIPRPINFERWRFLRQMVKRW